ncbi:rRNA maturation RNase YbeY [Pseudogemmobacter humi]|nr:rRNA maturation RNase YbeY [Pseudogemmobacter humi]
MTMLTETVFEDDRWQAFGLEDLAERAARAALAHLGHVPEDHLISVLACDDARIAALNTEFRGKPVPTNVLSWPSDERAAEEPGAEPEPPEPDPPEPDPTGGPLELGDIAIAYETCMSEAAAQGKDPAAHVTHLIVHAILHLLGYDHIHEADAQLMEAHEVRILAAMGLPDPY